MTKKDYKLIAGALRRSKPIKKYDILLWDMIVLEMAETLIEDNSRFKEDKFYEACTYSV